MKTAFLNAFNTAIMAGWVVLGILAVRCLLKKSPAWIKCALWALVALRLVWPFSIESNVSLIPSTETLPPVQLQTGVPQVNTGIPVLNAVFNPPVTDTILPETTQSVDRLQQITAIAAWVWVLGIAAMVLYALISYLRLQRRVRVCVQVQKGVYICDGLESPFILGLLRPRIYLPSDLPAEKWDSILAHERAHLSRRDHWWKPLGFVLLSVFWFHPLLWVGYILLCRDVELACDEKVIKTLTLPEKQAYSQVLLECSVPRKWISACPLAFGETGVKQRIKAVLHYKKPTLWILIVALLVSTVLAVCFLTNPMDKHSSPAEENSEEVYAVGDRVAGIITTGYFKDLTGYVRFTEDDILEYGVPETSGDISWVTLGKAEKFSLTKDNFDDLLGGIEIASTVREENEAAWRVTTVSGGYHYFLQQTDGNCYFLYHQRYLYALCSSTWLRVAGKTFVYENEGAGILGFDGFTISFQTNGRFSYYEGVYSSHIGSGTWSLDGNLLKMVETRGNFLSGPRECAYYFLVADNALIFLAERSDPFTYVDVAHGERFYAFRTNQPGVKSEQHLMWVQIEQYGDDYLYALDGDGNRWKVVIVGGVNQEKFPLDQCWVSYSGTPVEINETISGGQRVQYQIWGQCWYNKECPKGVDDTNLRPIYDYCYYDVDQDGEVEICVVSAVHTSGISTFEVSVWLNGVCEYSQWIQERNHSVSQAFYFSESGLCVITSAGEKYGIDCSEGTMRITRELP